MRHYIFLVIISFIGVTYIQDVFAQADTIYFNENWKTTTKDSAEYYRLSFRKHKNLFLIKDYYAETNIIQMHGYFSDVEQEYKEGWFIYYDTLGIKNHEGLYKNNKKEGRWVEYYPSTDSIFWVTHFNNDAADGTDTMYFRNGAIKRIEQYKNNELIWGKCLNKKGKEIPYYPYQVFPEFPGGLSALMNYLSKEINYPKVAQKNNTEGRAIAKFVVNEDGSLSDIHIIRSVSPEIDKEVLRVMQKMPNWSPGKQDNRPVKVWFTQPVTFRLED